MTPPRLITRVALFSALIYVLSWATVYLPNVKVIFFIVFTAGFLWGGPAGWLVGMIGTGLWTIFNPFGPAGIPVAVAQIVGGGLCGPVGAIVRKMRWARLNRLTLNTILVTAGAFCTLLYFVPVNTVDAWVYQPFWPRFIGALPWTAISLVSNMFIFPLLFPVARFLYARESESQ
ncbi:hypothetical protein C3F09_03285 [candidate division GN15 bacterium]|uniref:ECF transporter S component n=1 Tax=candidate division GN15 bacterium TaxID=2072418 RepID=A0A855X8V2_9BACT|nr:MAG: hypothetical protein C3F09_03285 [candidate division GN15 bacterium]